MRPTGGAPGVLEHVLTIAHNIAPNGRLPATLRPPIRANPSTRGFAGGRNVAEAKRAICERSEAQKAH